MVRKPKRETRHQVLVRFTDKGWRALEAYIDRQQDGPTRPEAVRRLVALGLEADAAGKKEGN
jgi:hypothetical protein